MMTLKMVLKVSQKQMKETQFCLKTFYLSESLDLLPVLNQSLHVRTGELVEKLHNSLVFCLYYLYLCLIITF